MTEEEIKLCAQLMAIEQLLTQHIAISYLSRGISLELAKSMHKLRIERARQETFPTGQPALSDHVAAEYEQHLERLLHDVEQKLAAVKAR